MAQGNGSLEFIRELKKKSDQLKQARKALAPMELRESELTKEISSLEAHLERAKGERERLLNNLADKRKAVEDPELVEASHKLAEIKKELGMYA